MTEHGESAICRIALVGMVALVTAMSLPTTLGAQRGKVPRTPDGHPDLQDMWDYRTATPLERPRDLPDKEFFTDQEAAAFEKQTADRGENVVAVHPPGWLDYGSKVVCPTGGLRLSSIGPTGASRR